MSKIQKIFEDSLFKIKVGLMINDVSFEEWKKIPSSATQNLVNSMSSRLKAVKKAKGFPTKY